MLHFQSVSYSYPHTDGNAVSDISFSLAPGRALLCAGRSGCGKSTLARLANGLAPQYLRGRMRGMVLVAGANSLHRPPARLARDIGTLFQDPERQFFALTVEEEMGIALRWRGWEGDRVRRAVLDKARLLGIEDLLPQSIFGLSEGQKQKVALASLLAAGPRLLVLDEPSANLDPESVAGLGRTLAMLKAEGVALLVVDHRLSWMRGIADKVLVLDDGRCAAYGDFSLLDDAALRERHGLRAAEVEDCRESLPQAKTDEGNDFFGCRDLFFAYPRSTPVFADAAFSFAPGRIMALTGANGAGKTTLARLLTGLERPARGEVYAAGKALKPKALPGYAQVVLQNAAHQLRMNSVAAELDDALPPHLPPATRRDEIAAGMERFGISHLARRHPQSLSGGEQQRLAVACAAVRRPRVLILDEPTSGLDGESMLRMAQAMERAARQGACLLVITHDLELMNRVCTEKIVLPNTDRRTT